jgi:hypothetical protein
MAKSTDACNSILALIFNATTWEGVAENDTTGALTNLYVCLHTGDPGVGGDQRTNEATYGSYGRVAVARTTSGWAVPAAGSTSNDAVAGIVFTEATSGSSNLITHVSIGTTGGTGAGKVLYAGQLSSSRTISEGIQPQFNRNSLVVSET